MPSPPTPLSIATSSLARLSQDLQSYRVESSAQEARIAALEVRLQREGPQAEDGNLEWILGQEVCFPALFFVSPGDFFGGVLLCWWGFQGL